MCWYSSEVKGPAYRRVATGDVCARDVLPNAGPVRERVVAEWGAVNVFSEVVI